MQAAVYQLIPAEEPEVAYVRAEGLAVDESINGLQLAAGMRDLLALVCRMREFGKDHCMWGSNDHVGKAANCHPNSVPRYLSWLEEQNLIDVKRYSGRREVRPTQLVRNLYLDKGNGLNNLLSLNNRLSNLTKDVKPKPAVKLPKPNVKHNIEENTNAISTSTTSSSASAELHARELRIQELEEEIKKKDARLEKAEKIYWQQQEEIASLKAQLANNKAAAPSVKRVARAPQPAVGHQKLYEVFEQWFLESTGAKPDMQAADWVATARLYKYLLDGSAKDEEMALNTFRSILSKWRTYDKFIQDNPTLRYIGNNINKIIKQHQHGQPKQPTRPGLVNNADVSANLRHLESLGLI